MIGTLKHLVLGLTKLFLEKLLAAGGGGRKVGSKVLSERL